MNIQVAVRTKAVFEYFIIETWSKVRMVKKRIMENLALWKPQKRAISALTQSFWQQNRKKWGVIFYCLVLEYHKNHLLMRTVYWYWQVCKPFQGTWPSSLSINRNPHHHKVVRAVGCIIHQKAKHHLFLKNEFPYLWGKKIISGIFSLWMEP